jgi:hypothetical protein
MAGISLHMAMEFDFSVVRQFSRPEQLLFGLLWVKLHAQRHPNADIQMVEP